MKLIWDIEKEDLECNGVHFKVWCHVRNEIDPNYVRRLHEKKEVIFAIVNGVQTKIPYMPRKFPKGTHEITSVEYLPKTNEQEVYWPLKIKTNAKQKVERWILDANEGYEKGTGEYVMDGGYHIHFSWSNTTHGCGRPETEIQARKLAEMVIEGFKSGKVYLEVI